MVGLARAKVTVDASALVFEKKILKQTLRAAGAEVKTAIRARLQQTFGSGRFYYGPGGSAAKHRGGYQGTRYQASAVGQDPVSVTGTLAKSVSVRLSKNGETVKIRDNAFYALMLETGAMGGGKSGSNEVSKRGGKRQIIRVGSSRVLTARPFMEEALEEREASLLPRIQQAARDGMKMQKIKL